MPAPISIFDPATIPEDELDLQDLVEQLVAAPNCFRCDQPWSMSGGGISVRQKRCEPCHIDGTVGSIALRLRDWDKAERILQRNYEVLEAPKVKPAPKPVAPPPPASKPHPLASAKPCPRCKKQPTKMNKWDDDGLLEPQCSCGLFCDDKSIKRYLDALNISLTKQCPRCKVLLLLELDDAGGYLNPSARCPKCQIVWDSPAFDRFVRNPEWFDNMAKLMAGITAETSAKPSAPKVDKSHLNVDYAVPEYEPERNHWRRIPGAEDYIMNQWLEVRRYVAGHGTKVGKVVKPNQYKGVLRVVLQVNKKGLPVRLDIAYANTRGTLNKTIRTWRKKK